MTSGPVVVQVLEGENAIAKYRDVMGATDPAKAAPRHHPQGARQIGRRKFGAWLRFRRHCAREIAQFFPDNDIVG